MSFKSEVREFMRLTEEAIKRLETPTKRREATIRAYKELNERLMVQNEKLMDRLMSRQLGEYKTFQLPDIGGHVGAEEPYDPLDDDALAGEVVMVEGDVNK